HAHCPSVHCIDRTSERSVVSHLEDFAASPPSTPAKKPRRFQIGLREAIVYMVILSAVFGLVGRAVDRMRRQERLVAYLNLRGFRIDYHDPAGLTRLAFGASHDDWPRWQRFMLLDVEGVTQTARFFASEDRLDEEQFWRTLAQLPALETLSVNKPMPK